MVPLAGPGRRDRGRLLVGVPDHAPRTAPTRSASATSARSCWSPTPAATPRPTSSPPASRTTRSARCSASTTTPAPAAPTCGPTACSRRCATCPPDARDARTRALPRQADMRVAIRRDAAGRHARRHAGRGPRRAARRPHAMTRRDLLEGNVDLLDAAGALLADRPVRRLRLTPSLAAADAHPAARPPGIDRVDVYLDGRPRGSGDVTDGAATLTFPGVGGRRPSRRGFRVRRAGGREDPAGGRHLTFGRHLRAALPAQACRQRPRRRLRQRADRGRPEGVDLAGRPSQRHRLGPRSRRRAGRW